MKIARYQPEDLARILETRRIATLPELKSALGTTAAMTVFRKLRPLGYRTSYSHGSRYYTLDRIARFDNRGLWSCRAVWFSRYGTLRNTLEQFVRGAEAGCFARELKTKLHVSVRESLLRLVRQDRVLRKPMSGGYLYCSPEPAVARRQVLSRQAQEREQGTPGAKIADEVRAAIVLFMSLLDEKQQRLYAGLESLKAGPGGDSLMAEILSLHSATVSRGRRELVSGEVLPARVRKAGGGRKPLEKKRRV